ncbi:Uncharacterized protein JF73_17120 (plasmid) [Lactobacillus helsingborgensis]|uniref:Uncharacterized protein n=1 Tax=Lactobacillus helsingborgensis TaxID=1218494 RepID=A0AA47B5N9_9LACO|nr:hypothetical protein [Lactobacillus helsingborgensis]KJY60540.1 Uncharacterized protein JF73_17120 [Lactobacillus helsingborgensis]UZX30584.1 hypothetical protein LDX53_09410 [Lactobacillus helsingborgensis]UZX32491.1 hypothetical protein LDX52_09390 [Lactobacillus helsingborgensis]
MRPRNKEKELRKDDARIKLNKIHKPTAKPILDTKKRAFSQPKAHIPDRKIKNKKDKSSSSKSAKISLGIGATTIIGGTAFAIVHNAESDPSTHPTTKNVNDSSLNFKAEKDSERKNNSHLPERKSKKKEAQNTLETFLGSNNKKTNSSNSKGQTIDSVTKSFSKATPKSNKELDKLSHEANASMKSAAELGKNMDLKNKKNGRKKQTNLSDNLQKNTPQKLESLNSKSNVNGNKLNEATMGNNLIGTSLDGNNEKNKLVGPKPNKTTNISHQGAGQLVKPNKPAKPDTDKPTKPGISKPDTDKPAKPGTSKPEEPSADTPATPTDNPTEPGMDTPATPTDNPTEPGMDTPATPTDDSPNEPGTDTPATPTDSPTELNKDPSIPPSDNQIGSNSNIIAEYPFQEIPNGSTKTVPCTTGDGKIEGYALLEKNNNIVTVKNIPEGFKLADLDEEGKSKQLLQWPDQIMVVRDENAMSFPIFGIPDGTKKFVTFEDGYGRDLGKGILSKSNGKVLIDGIPDGYELSDLVNGQSQQLWQWPDTVYLISYN